MPIYEYACSNCGQIIEALQKISDPPLSSCSKCGGTLEKMMSLNSFHLKGGGWYVTDYKGSAAPSSGEASSGAAKSADESKPAPSPVAAAAKAIETGAKPAAAKAG